MGIKVSIFGVAGYTGAQLLSILTNHSEIYIDAVFGNKTVGMSLPEIFQKNTNVPQKKIISHRDYNFKNSDLVFSCLPHGESQKILNDINGPKVIDLSADYRFDDISLYNAVYNIKHKSKKKNSAFLYGLPELNSNLIKKANFVSNPGCYPTSILIPIIPILKSNIINKKLDIFVDSKSGISGAGKKVTEQKQFMNLNQNFYPYNVCTHRHQYEIEQEMNKICKNFSMTFLTHLLPISRGLQSTIFIKNLNIEANDLRGFFLEYFKNFTFVKILGENQNPEISKVVGTNLISFAIYENKKNNTIIIISVIDNLIKGASGQAVQNMNLMFGLKEDEGLKNISIVP